MPITLIIRSPSEDIDSPLALTFDGTRIVIGRSPGCDVRLPDRSVSHRHAVIRVEGREPSLVDNGSSNGTFVGGVRLAPQSPRALRSGDLVRLGKVWLEVRLDHRPPTADLSVRTRDLALALVSRAMRAMGEDTVPKLSVVEGRDRGKTLPLFEEERAYTIGRSEDCDLALVDSDVSREHVHVTRRGSTVFLRDLGSKNGALLGDTLVVMGRENVWRSTLMMRIGRTVLALQEPVTETLLQLEDQDDEILSVSDTPPLPPKGSFAEPTSAAASSAKAPIAEVVSSKKRATKSRTGMEISASDVGIAILATVVMVLSIACLVWLLRS